MSISEHLLWGLIPTGRKPPVPAFDSIFELVSRIAFGSTRVPLSHPLFSLWSCVNASNFMKRRRLTIVIREHCFDVRVFYFLREEIQFVKKEYLKSSMNMG